MPATPPLWVTGHDPEQKAREQIEAMLIASGWVVQNYNAVDFSAGHGIAFREVPLTTGPCDYLLLVDLKAPVGVCESASTFRRATAQVA